MKIETGKRYLARSGRAVLITSNEGLLLTPYEFLGIFLDTGEKQTWRADGTNWIVPSAHDLVQPIKETQMNPALTPISEIRSMSNAQLIAFAKEHSHLTILEREMLQRLESATRTENRGERIQSIVDWAKGRGMQS